jgi:hypothetical protein
MGKVGDTQAGLEPTTHRLTGSVLATYIYKDWALFPMKS